MTEPVPVPPGSGRDPEDAARITDEAIAEELRGGGLLARMRRAARGGAPEALPLGPLRLDSRTVRC